MGVDAPWFHGAGATPERLREAAGRLRSMRFNSFAGWTNIATWGPFDDQLAANGEPTFGAFATIETGTDSGPFHRLVDAQGKDTGGTHAFPDPYDPRFEARYRARAHRVAEIVKGKPWFIAWFADNEVSHRELYRHVYSPHCAAALREFLRARYGDVTALNRGWQTSLASFDDVPGRIADIPAEGPIHNDLRLFEREIIRRYVQVTLNVIRAEDPDHLVFSNRFMLGDVTAWMNYLDLYLPYDGICVNIYPENQQPGLSEDERSVLRLVQEKTGKPMIIGEWSVPAADSGLYDNREKLDWSWNEVVPTQADRARQAAQVAMDFYNLPFLVGAHWFVWQDVDSEERQANRGLFKANGEPWSELIAALTAAHKAMGPPVEPE